MTWLNIGEGKKLQCPSCGAALGEFLLACDHHPIPCSACNETLVVLSTTTRTIAIALNKAPMELRFFFQWADRALDELEFISLMVALDGMFGEKGPEVVSSQRPLSFGRPRTLLQPTQFPSVGVDARTAG